MAKEKKSEATLERTYTVPLRRAYINSPPYKKANRAVRALREFLAKHMKSDDVRIGGHVNELIWAKGIKSPPPRVTVKAVKDSEGVVRAELEDKVYKESVKPIQKAKASTLQEKISEKLGGKKGKDEAEEPKAEEKPKKAEPKDEKKSEPKLEPKTLANAASGAGAKATVKKPKAEKTE